MSSKAHVKGYQQEIYVRDKLIQRGIAAERVPLSGLMGGIYDGDLCIPTVAAPDFKCEVKSRKSGAGFTVLEKWMQDKDIMFLKRDRQEPMVVLSWEVFIKLMKKNYGIEG